MLGRRRKRRISIKSPLGQRLVFAGLAIDGGVHRSVLSSMIDESELKAFPSISRKYYYNFQPTKLLREYINMSGTSLLIMIVIVM